MTFHVAQEASFDNRLNRVILSYFVVHSLWIVKDPSKKAPDGFWYPPSKTSSNQLQTLLKNGATPDKRSWLWYTQFSIISSHGNRSGLQINPYSLINFFLP